MLSKKLLNLSPILSIFLIPIINSLILLFYSFPVKKDLFQGIIIITVLTLVINLVILPITYIFTKILLTRILVSYSITYLIIWKVLKVMHWPGSLGFLIMGIAFSVLLYATILLKNIKLNR